MYLYYRAFADFFVVMPSEELNLRRVCSNDRYKLTIDLTWNKMF